MKSTAQACTGSHRLAQNCKNFSFLDWLGHPEYAKQVLAWLDYKQKSYCEPVQYCTGLHRLAQACTNLKKLFISRLVRLF